MIADCCCSGAILSASLRSLCNKSDQSSTSNSTSGEGGLFDGEIRTATVNSLAASLLKTPRVGCRRTSPRRGRSSLRAAGQPAQHVFAQRVQAIRDAIGFHVHQRVTLLKRIAGLD